MKNIIDALTEADLKDRVKLTVGGAPVNMKFASDIGADGNDAETGRTVSLTKKIIKAEPVPWK